MQWLGSDIARNHTYFSKHTHRGIRPCGSGRTSNCSRGFDIGAACHTWFSLGGYSGLEVRTGTLAFITASKEFTHPG